MPARIAPLLIGAPVCFDDRWRGHVSAIDVQQDWRVLNITVKTGLLAAKTVKLPFSAVTSWSDEMVRVALESLKAFAGETPPDAAPHQTLSPRGAVSHAGTRFAGLMVKTIDRRADEVLVARGGTPYRVPIGEARLEGESITFTQSPEKLVRYHSDAAITEAARDIIRDDGFTISDERVYVQADSVGGDVTLTGNVFTEVHKEHFEALVRKVPGVVGVQNDLHHEVEIEMLMGQALEREGLFHDGNVAARSVLGVVTLYGFAATQRAIDDIIITVQRVPGVRTVRSKLTVQPGRQPGS